MEQARTVWLVTNRASGSHSDDAEEAVLEAFQGGGTPVRRVLHLPDEALPTRADLEAANVATLVTLTGDGTANAAITALEGWGGEVLVLPGGTQNLLARSLHSERSAEEIIAAFAGGELTPIRRHLVRSRHGDGLCEIVAGPGAKWSEVREALRQGDVAELASAAREAIAQSAAGASVRVVGPALGRPEGYTGVRLHPVGERIAVDGYGADSLAEYAQQGLAILQRDFRQGPHDELGSHREVVCRSDAPIELMIDGERATGECEERFTIAPCGVTLLAHPDRDAG